MLLGRIALVRSPTMPPRRPLCVLVAVALAVSEAPIADSVPLVGTETGAESVLVGRIALVRPPTMPPRRPLCVLVTVALAVSEVPTAGSVALVGTETGAESVLVGRMALVRPPMMPPRSPLSVLVAVALVASDLTVALVGEVADSVPLAGTVAVADDGPGRTALVTSERMPSKRPPFSLLVELTAVVVVTGVLEADDEAVAVVLLLRTMPVSIAEPDCVEVVVRPEPRSRPSEGRDRIGFTSLLDLDSALLEAVELLSDESFLDVSASGRDVLGGMVPVTVVDGET